MSDKENEPFGRQPRPVSISFAGDDQRDVEEAIRRCKRVLESAGDLAERQGNMLKIYPRAVND